MLAAGRRRPARPRCRASAISPTWRIAQPVRRQGHGTSARRRLVGLAPSRHGSRQPDRRPAALLGCATAPTRLSGIPVSRHSTRGRRARPGQLYGRLDALRRGRPGPASPRRWSGDTGRTSSCRTAAATTPSTSGSMTTRRAQGRATRSAAGRANAARRGLLGATAGSDRSLAGAVPPRRRSRRDLEPPRTRCAWPVDGRSRSRALRRGRAQVEPRIARRRSGRRPATVRLFSVRRGDDRHAPGARAGRRPRASSVSMQRPHALTRAYALARSCSAQGAACRTRTLARASYPRRRLAAVLLHA